MSASGDEIDETPPKANKNEEYYFEGRHVSRSWFYTLQKRKREQDLVEACARKKWLAEFNKIVYELADDTEASCSSKLTYSENTDNSTTIYNATQCEESSLIVVDEAGPIMDNEDVLRGSAEK